MKTSVSFLGAAQDIAVTAIWPSSGTEEKFPLTYEGEQTIILSDAGQKYLKDYHMERCEDIHIGPDFAKTKGVGFSGWKSEETDGTPKNETEITFNFTGSPVPRNAIIKVAGHERKFDLTNPDDREDCIFAIGACMKGILKESFEWNDSKLNRLRTRDLVCLDKS